MKTLKAIGATVALAISSLGFASNVQAEPSKNATTYYVVGMDDEKIVVMPNSYDVHANTRIAWLFAYYAKPFQIDSSTIRATWLLVKFDCQAQTEQIDTIYTLSEPGDVIGAIAGGDAAKPQTGSTFGNALAAICGQKSPAVLLTQPQTEAVLTQYAKNGGKLQ